MALPGSSSRPEGAAALCIVNQRRPLQLAAHPLLSFPLHNWARDALHIRPPAQAPTRTYKSNGSWVNNEEYSRKISCFFSSHFCQETHFLGYLQEATAAEAQAHKYGQLLHDYSWSTFRVPA